MLFCYYRNHNFIRSSHLHCITDTVVFKRKSKPNFWNRCSTTDS